MWEVEKNNLVCHSCGAKANDNSKERNRFHKRHPSKCQERKKVAVALAQDTKAVDYDVSQSEAIAKAMVADSLRRL